MTSRMIKISSAVLLSVLSAAVHAQSPVKFDSGTVSGLAARNLGSEEMSGRIAGHG